MSASLDRTAQPVAEITAAAEQGVQRIQGARICLLVPGLLRPVPLVSRDHVIGRVEPLYR
jgi:hypothetical protein